MPSLQAFTSLGAYLIYFFFYNPHNHICTSLEKSQNFCTLTYSPVCALSTGPQCRTGYRHCQQTMSNPCTACSNIWVISYVPGECPIKEGGACLTRTTTCIMEYRPVCVFSETPGGEMFIRDAPNPCVACSLNPYTVFYIDGLCPSKPPGRKSSEDDLYDDIW